MLTLAELKIILTAGQEGWKWAGVVRRGWDLVRSQNRRGLMRLFPFENVQLVVPAQSAGADYQFTTEHDRQAADCVKSAMAEIAVKVSVLNSSNASTIPEENLISICGPAANIVSKIVFEKRADVPFQFVFKQDENRWIIQHLLPSGRKLEYGRAAGDPIDYAILLKVRNPAASSRTVYLGAGIAGLGTMAAAWLLTKGHKNLLRELQQAKIHERESYACLLHCFSAKASDAEKAQEDLHVAILNIEQC